MRVAIVLGLAVCVSALPFSFSNNGLSNNRDYKEVLIQAEEYLKEQLAAGKISQEFVNTIHQKLGGLSQNIQVYSQADPPSEGFNSRNLQKRAIYSPYDVQQILKDLLQYLRPYPPVAPRFIIQHLIEFYELALFLYQQSQLFVQSQVQVGFGGFGYPYFNPFLTGNPFYGPHIYGGPFMGK